MQDIQSLPHLLDPKLTQLLLAEPSKAQTIVQQLNEQQGEQAGDQQLWRDLVALAGYWRVIPQLRQALQTLKVQLDPVAQKELTHRATVAAIQSTTVAHRGVVAMQGLQDCGVSAIAFKGIGLLGQLYAKACDRMVTDIDVLIHEADLAQACACLTALGFSAEVSGSLDDYLDYLKNRTCPDNYFLIFKDAQGIEIDLHWTLMATASGRFEVDDLLQRGEMATVQGRSIRVASPADAMLLTVHHALRENFAPDTTTKDLCDLSAWWASCDRWDLSEVIERAKATGFATALLALWHMLVALNPEHPAQQGIDALSAQLSKAACREAMTFAEVFQMQVEGHAVNTAFVNVLDWKTIQRFIHRRLQKNSTLAFDKVLWGIQHDPQMYWRKLQHLWQTVAQLDRRKFRTYQALARMNGKV
jgi:Uncharacterised nucleotidyltransferase